VFSFSRCREGWWRSALVLLFITASLSGCSQLHQLLHSPPSTPAATPLMLGYIGAAVGPGGFEGNFTKNALQLAIGDINGAGGVMWQGRRYHLASTHIDSLDVTQQMRSLIFLNPSPIAILGPDESGPVAQTQAIAQSAHIPEVTIATAPDLTDPSKDQNDTMIFRARASDVALARAVATYAVQHLNAREIALATIDSDYGHGGGDVIAHTLAALNVTPATQVTLEPTTFDVTAQVAQIQTAHSDTVICWSTEIEAANLLHSLRVAGWRGHFVVGMADADFIALAGADGEGVVGATTWSAADASEMSRQFLQQYMQRFGSVPDEHAAAMYDAVQLIAAAVRTVGPDRAAIARYLSTVTDYTGLQGEFDAVGANKALGSQGDLTTALDIVQIHAGQQIVVSQTGG
jgi:branched-chain amino acid transport system substrate-binding protein